MTTLSERTDGPAIGGVTSGTWTPGSQAQLEASAAGVAARKDKAGRVVRLAARGIEQVTRQVLDGAIELRHGADAAAMVRAWTGVLELASDESAAADRHALIARMAELVGSRVVVQPTAIVVGDEGS